MTESCAVAPKYRRRVNLAMRRAITSILRVSALNRGCFSAADTLNEVLCGSDKGHTKARLSSKAPSVTQWKTKAFLAGFVSPPPLPRVFKSG